MLSTVLLTHLLTAAPIEVPFERSTLANGLTVILHEDHSQPRVVVETYFAVGSADEKPKRSGFAHLFEHLMFMGTAAVPNGEFDKVMEQAGGQNNATTDFDETRYFEQGPSNLLETFLYLEGDRLAHLADDMTQAKVDLQRDVVKNERRQSYENRPYGLSEQIMVDKLFPEGHPYHHATIGSHADLSAASVDDVKAFFRTHYVPANASMVIAGDFDPAEAKKWAEKYLGVLPRADAPPRTPFPLARLTRAVRVTQPDDVQQDRVELFWLAPPRFSRGSAEAELLAEVLGGAKSARLVKALVIDQGLAESVEVLFQGARGQSVFSIAATAQPGHSAAEVEKALETELQALLTKGPAEAEVSRGRARLQTANLTHLEDLLARSRWLNSAEQQFGDPGQVPHAYITRFEAVSPSGLHEAARSMLGAPRLTITFVPKAKPQTQRKAGGK